MKNLQRFEEYKAYCIKFEKKASDPKVLKFYFAFMKEIIRMMCDD